MSEKQADKPEAESENQDFLKAYQGYFHGILRWPQLDALWKTVKVLNDKDNRWFVYAPGEKPPENPQDKNSLSNFIEEMDRLLRREHDEDYCGIVYTDDLQEPAIIKIFDPNHLGTSCGTAKTAPLPGWILSRQKPIDIPTALNQQSIGQANNRKQWWNRLFK